MPDSSFLVFVMTHHIVLQIAYDGSLYLGWQKTKEGPSVEETLTFALSTIFSEKVLLRAASRTDRGVHAEGQVVDFFVEKLPKDLNKIQVSLNQLLPPCIRCLSINFAPFPQFHSTLSAIKKKYRYSISTGAVQLPRFRATHWFIRNHIDSSILREAAGLLIGTHDFRGLSNQKDNFYEKDTQRTVYSIEILEKTSSNELIIEITGNRFLYKMVRNIVGTLMWIATGKLDITTINTVLCSKKRACAGVTAPAHGLTLVEITFSHVA